MRLPLRKISITQHYGYTPFAQAHKDWYKNGIHYGVDFRCSVGTQIYAPISGKVHPYESTLGGKSLLISNGKEKIACYHLSDWNVKNGVNVAEGHSIALSGSSGEATTGPHLHLSYLIDDKQVNPELYFDKLFTGEKISNKDWEKSPVYHRYGRKREYAAEVYMLFHNAWVAKQVKKYKNRSRLTVEEVNAIIYGGWDFETVMQETMYQYWAFYKKDEYNKIFK
jgi:hypothetical protein